MTAPETPEFSVVVKPSALLAEEAVRTFEIEAKQTECAALADRFGFLAIDFLRASIRLRPVRGSGDFRLTGHLSARVVRSCVVTLAPVTSEIDHDFDVLLCADTGDEERLAELDDDIELFSGDSIDIGEITAVELALCVDPYPRAPGVPDEAPGPGGEKTGETGSGNRPFEVLASLKRPDKSR